MSKCDLINKSYLVTLNQRVQGSSPCAPTKQNQALKSIFPGIWLRAKRAVHTFVHTFCGSVRRTAVAVVMIGDRRAFSGPAMSRKQDHRRAALLRQHAIELREQVAHESDPVRRR